MPDYFTIFVFSLVVGCIKPESQRVSELCPFRTGIRPTPEPSMQDDPFVNNIHGSRSSSLTSMIMTMESSSGRPTMKSAKIYPFTDVLGMYCMSYSPSSILDFCILPTKSGFDSTCLIGWSVMTMIGCAWKYLFSLLLACTRDNTNFSIGRPHIPPNLCQFAFGMLCLPDAGKSLWRSLNQGYLGVAEYPLACD
nr:hypothetical protein [Tanacetum cinerariifolium]